MKWAWETPVRGVGQHVLLALANLADKETRQCHPSLGELAGQTGLGVSTIRRTLRALEDAGLIKADVTHGGRRMRSNYTLMVGAEFLTVEKPARSGRVSETDTRQIRAGIAEGTHSERAGSEQKTRPLRAENPPAAGDVVLRTQPDTREPGTTGAAVASPEPGLFPVERPSAPGSELAVRTITGSDAVRVWYEAYTESHDARPTKGERGQVGREAAALIAAGNPPERVLAAARSAGARGFPTVQREYRQLAARNGQAQQQPRRPAATSRAVSEARALKAMFPQGGVA